MISPFSSIEAASPKAHVLKPMSRTLRRMRVCAYAPLTAQQFGRDLSHTLLFKIKGDVEGRAEVDTLIPLEI